MEARPLSAFLLPAMELMPMQFVRLFSFAVCLIAGSACCAPALADQDAKAEPVDVRWTFDDFESGTAINDVEKWEAFRGFNGTQPVAKVVAGAGRNGSNALAVSHSEEFRTDGWGIRRYLAEPISGGVVWLQCYFRPASTWTGGIYFDARAGREIVARIGGARQAAKEDKPATFYVHATWTKSYWRMHQHLQLTDDWYRLTMRMDLDAGTYAAWINDQVLGEELPVSSQEPIDHLYIGLGGTPEQPALIDDITVSRTAPSEQSLRDLLPEPKPGMKFRMAVIGDPQLGFGGYEADLVRFNQAIEQANRSGAELTLVMGDMVHDDKNEQAYRDLAEAAKALQGPCYFVRGNHDDLDLYQKYFHPQADFAFVHKGWRFVFLDAIGNLRGLGEKQLAFTRQEFEQATAAGEEIVLCLHVSPWQENERGRGAYNQIGPGRDQLVELLDKHEAMFCLSGHYHRGLWHVQQQATHYMVFGGTALVRGGYLGWSTFDIYPDRVEMHQKPLYFAYERPDAETFYNYGSQAWTSYEQAQQATPYLQRGPAIMPRKSAGK